MKRHRDQLDTRENTKLSTIKQLRVREAETPNRALPIQASISGDVDG